MNVALDANHASLFDERASLASLVQRIQDRVAASDSQVDDALSGLNHAKAALNARRLILDAVEDVADPLVVAEAMSLDPDTIEGEQPSAQIPVETVMSYLYDLHRQLRNFLGPSSSTIDNDVRGLQERLQHQRDEITRRRAAIHDRLVSVYDALQKTLALAERLVTDYKLGRQRNFDDTLIEVLRQRAIAFDLKLQAMRRRLEFDTYRPGAVQALRCIRDRLRADVDLARGEWDAVRRRLGQYEGIVEFDQIVAEYGEVRRKIALQKQLIQQLNMNDSGTSPI